MMYARRLEAAELAKLLSQDQLKEQLALDALRDLINQSYPEGHFVAAQAGQIIASAPSFDEITAFLKAKGFDPKESVVIQAGRRVSNYVFIHSLPKI